VARIIFFFLVLNLLWAEYLPNKVLVELKSGDWTVRSLSSATDVSPRLEKLLGNYGAAEIEKISDAPRGRSLLQSSVADPLANYYSVEYPSTINVELLVEILKNDPEVADAQPVFIYRIQDVSPNDTYYSNQENYFNLINAPAGWDIATGSAAVRIAVVDSGVAVHSDLDLDTAAWHDFVDENNTSPIDPNGHGTIVAGLAAAIGNNGVGITGLDWNAKILPVRVMKDDGTGDTKTIALGINYAANQGADVINMSLGGLSDNGDRALKTACDYAYGRGSILVAAVGNIGEGIGENSIVYPAAYENVLSVGSVDSIGNRSGFSVKKPDVMAPGEKMFSTDKSGNYSDHSSAGNYNGTSFATPLVSGLMGLLRAQDPGLKPADAMEIVKKTARPAGNSAEYGWGIISVDHALTRTVYSRASSDSKNLKVLSAPNPTQKTVNFSFPIDVPVDNVRIYIYDQRGRKAQELDYGASLLGGMYVTPEWDLLGADGRTLANGSYIYVVKVTAKDGSISYGKNILSIVR
jgi:thermitase